MVKVNLRAKYLGRKSFRLKSVVRTETPIQPPTQLSAVERIKAKFRYAILLADRSEAGRRQLWGWSQTCRELEFGLSSSSLAAC